jgi:hypothetical protein
MRLLPIFSPPKDDSPEAALSGDIDELPESEKVDEPIRVEDIGEGD